MEGQNSYAARRPFKIDAAERDRRAIAVASALGSVRIEDLNPGPEALAIAARFIEGDLTIQEVVNQIRKLELRLSRKGRHKSESQ